MDPTLPVNLEQYLPGLHLPKSISLERSDPISRSERDVRGLLLVWEPPLPDEIYIVSGDPAYGIPGWCRELRTANDRLKDNSAADVTRVGLNGQPDVQVAEFAAPIEPDIFGNLLVFLGRLYHGIHEEALVIPEVQPGPGLITLRQMMDVHHYQNIFVWQTLDSYAAAPTKSLGWYAQPRSVQLLWSRGAARLVRRKVKIKSAYLAEELKYARYDAVKQTGAAASGRHDDRIRAHMMGGWAGHGWSDQLDQGEVAEIDGEESTLPESYACGGLLNSTGKMILTQADADADWEERFWSAQRD